MNIYSLKPANQNTRTARMSEIMDGMRTCVPGCVTKCERGMGVKIGQK